MIQTASMAPMDRVGDEVRAALASASDEAVPAADRIQMLVEMATGLQHRPRSPQHLAAAVQLYDRALALAADQLTHARLSARRATALQADPGGGIETLEAARDAYEAALPVVQAEGIAEEVAELEMNLGLVLQALAGEGRAPITLAIAAYQRALRTFDRARHPRELAILQNNLATAFLSMPLVDERARMREALAVQAFEEGLRAVTLVDHPAEYAMLQNNLGNALQYATSGHPVANNVRALAAYDEALKVRRAETTPIEYANTIANRANCLANLPDDLEHPELGNPRGLRQACNGYTEAATIFARHGLQDRARLVAEVAAELERELLAEAGEHG
jgi:hypothetical protein